MTNLFEIAEVKHAIEEIMLGGYGRVTIELVIQDHNVQTISVSKNRVFKVDTASKKNYGKDNG